jgi:hypothetical protein
MIARNNAPLYSLATWPAPSDRLVLLRAEQQPASGLRGVAARGDPGAGRLSLPAALLHQGHGRRGGEVARSGQVFSDRLVESSHTKGPRSRCSAARSVETLNQTANNLVGGVVVSSARSVFISEPGLSREPREARYLLALI